MSTQSALGNSALDLHSSVGASNVLAQLAWRNLWRNKRRTWLTAGGIAFAVWMLVFSWSMNDGTFSIMTDTAARMMSGHVQVQHEEYVDNPLLENLIPDVADLVDRAQDLVAVEAVAARLQSTALLSAGERSFGAQVIGVHPQDEQSWSTLARALEEGRYVRSAGEIVLGAALARNLHADINDEVVMLGTALEGGVAAHAATVVGLVSTGQIQVDRSIAQIHIADFREAWNISPNKAHVVAVVVAHPSNAVGVAQALTTPSLASRSWQEFMPEMTQMIDLKRAGQGLFFTLISIIVVFSVVNTFMMTVFERTQELGMMRALGMRGGQLQTQLHIEALWLSLLGIVLGVGLSVVMVAGLSTVGIPMPVQSQDLLTQFHMPDRLYPVYSWAATWIAVGALLVGTQLAVVLPAVRVRRMLPVEALRKED